MPLSTASCWFMRWKCPNDPEGPVCARCGGACWRPSGRMMAVVPNRRGVWDAQPTPHARSVHGPAVFAFADHRSCCGRPGSRRRAWGEGAVHAAGSGRLVPALPPNGVGSASAPRLSLPFAGVSHRGSHQAGVPARSPAHRERGARLISGAAAGAGARRPCNAMMHRRNAETVPQELRGEMLTSFSRIEIGRSASTGRGQAHRGVGPVRPAAGGAGNAPPPS